MKAANLYFINMSPVKFHLLAPVAQAQNFLPWITHLYSLLKLNENSLHSIMSKVKI